jgi:hypothetical protein
MLKKKSGLTGGARVSDLMSRIGTGRSSSPARRIHSEQATGRRAAAGELTGVGGDRRRGVLAAAVVLLGHFLQALRRGWLRSAGNGRWPARMSSSASSAQGTGEREMLSRRFLVMARTFSGKNGGFI